MGAVILVVDDEPPVCRLIERILKSKGHCVYLAHTLQEAANIAHILGAELDVLLFDLFLNHESGVDVLKAVYTLCPSVIPILMSGEFIPDTVDSAFPVDGISVFVLSKPFTANDLHDMVARAINSRDDSLN